MISEDLIRKNWFNTFETMKIYKEEKENRRFGNYMPAYDSSITWLQCWQACAKWILELKDPCECCGREKYVS